jgi:hypothetical protein
MPTFYFIKSLKDDKPVVKLYKIRNNKPQIIGTESINDNDAEITQNALRLIALDMLESLYGYRHKGLEFTRRDVCLIRFDAW